MHFIARLNDVKLSVPGIWLLTLTSNHDTPGQVEGVLSPTVKQKQN